MDRSGHYVLSHKEIGQIMSLVIVASTPLILAVTFVLLSDGEKVVIKESIGVQCITVKYMEYRGGVGHNVIPQLDVRSTRVLVAVYLKKYEGSTLVEIKDSYVFLAMEELPELFGQILAKDFLGMYDLLDMCSAHMAKMIENKSKEEALRMLYDRADPDGPFST